MDLFEKALEWYQSYNDGKRQAALELFPKKRLEEAVEGYKKKKEKEKLERREKDLKKNLEKCKELFPVGTLMWSDDGTDKCPNLIISEPYISETKYKAPWGVYDTGYNGIKKTILANSIRLYHNEPLEGDWKFDKVGLEICLDNMNKKSDYVRRNYVIDLDEFYNTEKEEKEKKLKWLKDNRERTQKELDRLNEEISELESYDPTKMTKEHIKELLKQYA